jgi:hypothetical protein
MIISEYKEKVKKWNCFAASDTLGSFDFYTTIVSLDSLDTSDIEACNQSIHQYAQQRAHRSTEILVSSSYRAITKVYPLAAHEYSHFFDSTSTLWGLRHLLLMKEAYESNDQFGGHETEFYKARLFYDHVRRLRLPRYYTLIDDNASNIKPWTYQYSAGTVFDSKGEVSALPTVFTRFSNSNGGFLVRSPISMVSLLEMSAMSQEVLMHLSFLEMTNEDFRNVEGGLYSCRLMDYLYNPRITEYSVCVHLVSNKLNLADPHMAFRVCAYISRLILNMPDSRFEDLASPALIADVLEISGEHAFVERLVSGLNARDYGTLFFIFASAFSRTSWHESQPVSELIHSTLEILGMSMQQLQAQSQAEAAALSQIIGSSHFEEISSLADACYENFEKASEDDFRIPFERINLPPALLGDSASCLIFPNRENRLATFDIDMAFNNLYGRGQEWVERFAEACL